MSEFDTIKKTKKPLILKDFFDGFRALGLSSDDVVLVHSSLSSLGYVIGGASTVIEALQAFVHDGTILMPSQTGEYSDPSLWENPPVPKSWIPTMKTHMPAYDKYRTPTRGMGKIAELFRTWPDVYRSDHPMDSFSAWGKEAKWMVFDHALTAGFGKGSPLQKLYDKKGKIILIGVDYDVCTFLHYPETQVPQARKKQYESPVMIDGKRVWMTYEDYDVSRVDFRKLGDAYEKEHQVKQVQIGQATVKCIDTHSLYRFAYNYMKHELEK